MVSFTGSLQGTSSWANNAVTASYAETSATASYSTTLGSNLVNSGGGGLVLRSSNNTALTTISAFTASLAIIASQSLIYKTTPGGNYGDNYILLATQSGADSDPRGVAFASALGYNAIQNRLNVGNVSATTLTGSLSGNLTGSVLGTASYVTGSIFTGANRVASASNAISASYALNGGVTQIVAGTNITLSPTDGLGAVTINSTGGSGAAFPFNGNAVITGSLLVSGSSSGLSGITGSLQGTASFSTNTYANLKYQHLELGVSSPLATIAPGQKGYKYVGYSGTITGWRIATNASGSVIIDVYKKNGVLPTSADAITAAAQPQITNNAAIASTTLTGWNTSVSPGDIFSIEVVSNDLATYISFILDIQLTNA